METPLVFNIQKYSIHDGDGIRTSIFFKGCPLDCAWCHNPESQRYCHELMFFDSRCTGCGNCISRCPSKAISIADGKAVTNRELCSACGVCTDWCYNSAREVAGKTYTVEELVKEAEKDRMFYESSGGGITLSGGEVMAQNMDYVEQVCKTLYDKGYSVDIDTSGYAPYENFQRILPYVDTFLYDIKAMKDEVHREYIGTSNQLILENLIKLNQDGARINIRIPLVLGVNADDEFIQAVISFLKEHNISVTQVNLLPYHNTGMHKYKKLDRAYLKEEQMGVPSNELMEHFQAMFAENGYLNTKIGG